VRLAAEERQQRLAYGRQVSSLGFPSGVVDKPVRTPGEGINSTVPAGTEGGAVTVGSARCVVNGQRRPRTARFPTGSERFDRRTGRSQSGESLTSMRTGPEEWIRVRQRQEWNTARRGWCQAHGVDLRALISQRRAEPVYRIEMRRPTWSWPTSSAQPSRVAIGIRDGVRPAPRAVLVVDALNECLERVARDDLIAAGIDFYSMHYLELLDLLGAESPHHPHAGRRDPSLGSPLRAVVPSPLVLEDQFTDRIGNPRGQPHAVASPPCLPGTGSGASCTTAKAQPGSGDATSRSIVSWSSGPPMSSRTWSHRPDL
jgi:hypothetical protein